MRLFSRVRHVVLATAVMVLGAYNVYGQAVSDLDQKAWEAINNKIIAKIQGIDPTLLQTFAIQLPSAPLYVMWDQGENGEWEFLNVADQIPKWGPTWIPKNDRFSQEYLLFANSVAIRSRTDVKAKELDAADKAYKNLNLQTSAALRALLAERKTYVKEQKDAGSAVMPYSDWVTDESVNGPKWKSLQAKQAAAYTAWSNLLSPEERSLGLLKKKMTEYSSDLTVKGETRYPYNYAAASLTQIKSDGDTAWSNHTPVFQFDSKSDTDHKDVEHTTWGGGASFNSFITISANAHSDHYSLDITNQASSFTYAAYGFGFIGIEPGGWYSGALVTQYKDKTRAFLPQSPVSFESLWGPTGSLNLQTVGVVVAYRPQITAHMTSSMIKQVKDTLTAGGSVSWGPLSFGGSYTKTTETYDAHSEEGLITISSASPYPYVIAVLSRRLNYVEQ
jgi:hypothetical protein